MSVKAVILFIFIFLYIFGCSTQSKKSIAYEFVQKSSMIDTSFIARATVAGICPCKTTLADLNNVQALEAVTIENRDQGQNCLDADKSIDGFQMKSEKGIFLIKDESTEYISTIHLTKDFEGILPNGKFVSIRGLTVSDVVKMYPNFKYITRDCSDYWNYNNGTLNFYFKVDTTIEKYPLNEEFYADHPIESVDISLGCYKMYGPDYSEEIVYARPMYAPLSETHLNAYVMKERNDFGSTIKEIATAGKKGTIDIIRLGRWLEYTPDHQLIVEEYYDNIGALLKKLR